MSGDDRRALTTDYDSLPVLEGLSMPHSWDLFDHNLGALELLNQETVMSALATARTGRRVGIVTPLHRPDPPMFGREPLQHEVFQIDRNTWDDRLDHFYPQGSSQWDGFRHVRCREFGFYGGEQRNPAAGESWLGVDHWAEGGIIGRGVLLDLASQVSPDGAPFDPQSGTAVLATDLERAAAEQGVEIRPGDILCLRFGWTDPGTTPLQSESDRRLRFSGLSGGTDMARRLWNWHVAAVVADNPAVEVSPGNAQDGSLHRRLLPLLGIPLGELFDFAKLADVCAESGKWDFLFVSVPLALVGGVGSPGNAIAIV
jgi:kynurenine formamidase